VDTWRRVQVARPGGAWEDAPLPQGVPNGFDAEIAESMAAIRDGRRPSVTGEDGRAALEIIQAIYAAATTDQPVRLPLTASR
jgi:predicted dehydrogenase